MAVIAVSGASGFVGSALCSALAAEGHEVRRLVRPGTDVAGPAISYVPGETLDPRPLADCDALVHLAGEGIAESRWTDARKRSLRTSRIGSTRTFADALARLGKHAPRWVSASAVGFYGNRGDAIVDEEAGAGQGFLADLCVEWEAATSPASRAGVAVAHSRFGVILGPGGGALARMLPIFRLGLGGRLGSGTQWMSWMGLSDAVRALAHLALGSELTGPVNLCAPEPVTNADFTAALAKALGRPALVPVPKLLLRAALGEMAEEALLSGQRAVPLRLLQEGFAFERADLDSCLAWCLE